MFSFFNYEATGRPAAPGLSDFPRFVLRFPIVALGKNIPTELAGKTIHMVSKKK